MELPRGYEAAGGLGLLAMTLNRRLGDDMDGTFLLRSVDGFLEMKPLGDVPALDPFVGFVAPDDWEIIGVVAHGTARNVNDGRTTRGRLVHLLTRHGDDFTLNSIDDEDHTVQWRCSARDGVSDGPIEDALRRSFDLPTPPPAFEVSDLRWAVMMGNVSIEGIDPVLAGWADDGTFYRMYRNQIVELLT